VSAAVDQLGRRNLKAVEPAEYSRRSSDPPSLEPRHRVLLLIMLSPHQVMPVFGYIAPM